MAQAFIRFSDDGRVSSVSIPSIGSHRVKIRADQLQEGMRVCPVSPWNDRQSYVVEDVRDTRDGQIMVRANNDTLTEYFDPSDRLWIQY